MTEEEYMKKNDYEYCMHCGSGYVEAKENRRYERSISMKVKFHRELNKRLKDKTQRTTLRMELISVPVKEKVTK